MKNGVLLPPKVGWGNQTYYVIKEDTDFDLPSVSEDLTVRSDFVPSNSVSSLTKPGTDVKGSWTLALVYKVLNYISTSSHPSSYY